MESIARVRAGVEALPPGRWLLAVSGGRDSMVLLEAFATLRAGEIAAVATFDHGTGPSATRAADLVVREGGSRGLLVVRGSAARRMPATEEGWRRARWAFLRREAAALGAKVVTAHSWDDQVETVVIRLLRGSGPRGIAGMLAPDPDGPVRPLLRVPRAAIASVARSLRVPFVEDPSNATRHFLRNRVRHELLPALERVAPGFGDWCGDLGERAAAWRATVERWAESLGVVSVDASRAIVPASAVASLDAAGWTLLCPVLCARAGVVMDRRGLVRAAAWAPQARPGQSIPLAGGARLARTRTTYVAEGTVRPAQDYIA